ncbi:hypothetical protein [Asticcacaulis sp.]|uniref:hypothetical protein n=1 Tax=Asticcacaulis sp. TaxID=1872648 RepID=UPI002CA16044|nr:hypothetical protein [Asticcacaulis sp.]HTM82236.1 hypothetical protein [Asticcacaulis sp.]
MHLGLLLLLMPSAKGLASIGSTGAGSIDGAGTAVTLVDASELVTPKASEATSSATQAETAASDAAVDETPTEAADTSERTDEVKPATENQSASETETVLSDSRAPSDSSMEAAAGAHGQNGQANTELWNAIAPCWNRIADKDTLSATLTISFAADGGLAVPPVIERNPDVPITDQSLQSEAKALAALSACGPYPMVSDQQNIAVVFPVFLAQ